MAVAARDKGHLRIRPLTSNDAPALLRAVQSNRAHLATWLDTPSRIYSIETATRAASEARAGGKAARFGVFHGVEIVGAGKIIEPTEGSVHHEIGIWVAEAWTRQGVGRWLASVLISELQAEGAQVAMRHEVGNEASRRLIQSLGLRPVGRSLDPTTGKQFVSFATGEPLQVRD